MSVEAAAGGGEVGDVMVGDWSSDDCGGGEAGWEAVEVGEVRGVEAAEAEDAAEVGEASGEDDASAA